MNNSPLDEHIRKQFGDYKPDVPAHIWERIAAEKDRKKPLAFWQKPAVVGLLILAGLLFITGTVFIYRHNQAVQDNKKTEATENKTTGESSTLVTTDGTTPATKDLKTSDNSKPGSITSSDEPVAIRDHSGNKNQTDANTGQPSGNTALPVTRNGRGNNLSKRIGEKQGVAPVTAKKNDNSDVLSSQQKISKNKTKTGIITSTGDIEDNSVSAGTGLSQRNKNKKKTKPAAAIRIQDGEVANGQEQQINSAETVDENREFVLNRILLNAGLLGSERNKLISVTKPVVPVLNVPCPASEKNAAGNKRYLEVYAGPDYAIKKITDTGNSVYLQKRKESEHFSSAFSAGIRYTKVFNNGMSFRAGLNYSQINEKFKYAQGNIIQIVYIVNSNGDTTGSYTTTGTRYKTTYNRYKTLDIPLVLGYEFGNGRWHANVNAGAVINLYSWQKGDVLDTTYNPVTITTGKAAAPYQLKSNVGLGFVGAVSVYYKLTDRLHILAEPYFRYNFSPVSKEALTVKQKYNTLGIRLGIRLDF